MPLRRFAHWDKTNSILCLTYRWQAIVQGAVQHGLSVHESLSQSALDRQGDIRSGIVQSRRVRESYGISAMEPYFAELHSKCKHKVFFSILHGAMMCPARMQWFIKKVAIHNPHNDEISWTNSTDHTSSRAKNCAMMSPIKCQVFGGYFLWGL